MTAALPSWMEASKAEGQSSRLGWGDEGAYPAYSWCCGWAAGPVATATVPRLPSVWQRPLLSLE